MAYHCRIDLLIYKKRITIAADNKKKKYKNHQTRMSTLKNLKPYYKIVRNNADNVAWPTYFF